MIIPANKVEVAGTFVIHPGESPNVTFIFGLNQSQACLDSREGGTDPVSF